MICYPEGHLWKAKLWGQWYQILVLRNWREIGGWWFLNPGWTVHFKCLGIIPDQCNQKLWRWDLVIGIFLPITQVIVHPRPTLVKKELFSSSVTFTQYCWVNSWIYLLSNSGRAAPTLSSTPLLTAQPMLWHPLPADFQRTQSWTESLPTFLPLLE